MPAPHPIERFLPKLDSQSGTQRLRWRLAVLLLRLSGTALLLIFAVRLALGDSMGATFFMVPFCGLLSLALSWRMQRTSDWQTAVAFIMACGLILLPIRSLAMGGFHGTVIAWVLLLPLICGLVAPPRATAAVTVLCVLELIAVAVLEQNGVGIQYPDNGIAGPVISLTLCVLVVGVSAVIYELERTIHEERSRESFSAMEAQRRDARLAADSKAAFLANMSHEIRTPMNGVIGLLAELKTTGLDEHQLDLVRTISSSAGLMVGLMNTVLDLSRLEQGAVELRPVPLSLHRLLRELRALLAGQAAERGLYLRLDRSPALPDHVVADGMRLRQVLVNLISNAVKFTHEGGVTITATGHASAGHAQLQISVRDTGIGIAPDKQEHIFGRFSQADDSITRRFGGTGLGLAISRELAHAMGGTLSVHSTEGDGSTFTLSLALPIATGLPEDTDTIKLLPLPAGLRVLLAEDNALNQRVAQFTLGQIGIEDLVLTDNGRQALDALKVSPRRFDLVILDCEMPEMDGLTAARRIRASPALRHLPIVGLSAHALPEARAAGLAAGMDLYLTKPIQKEAIHRAILTLLTEAPAADETERTDTD